MIIPATLSFLFETNSTLALVDVREYGEYNTAHIPGSSSLPRRLIEYRFERLVPSRAVQVVLCDDDGRRAWLAAETVENTGYERVAVLEGGLNRWATEGRPVEWGMNVVSKDFGEKVEVQCHVPTISPLELERRQRQGEDLLILDTRTPEEFQRACIPGGRSVPGGELALRITDLLRERPDASVVVNCAGRTRSIIGARTLQRMGVPNIVSLRNGTSGWTLAGLDVERGATRTELPSPSPEGRAAAEAFALRVAAEDGVQLLDIDGLDALLNERGQRAVYLIDVRGREEFEAGHIPGFWWFPGGQAVQRADDVAAVRNGAMVFCCDGVARAAIAASWYRQVGFPNVYAVRGGTPAWTAAGRPLESGPAELEPWGLAEASAQVGQLTPADLNSAIESESAPALLFVGTSDDFAAGHLPGSRWLSRSWLEFEIEQFVPDRSRRVVLTDGDGQSAILAAATLKQLGYELAFALDGGVRAWRAAGLPVERGLAGVMHPPTDVVAAGPDRTSADMVHYLAWEEALGAKYEQ
jgi:rhodanese-related sulfurtransferase